MCANEAGRNYLEADIRTASPLRLVVLVCDLGIDHLNKAVDALQPDVDRDAFVEHSGKARDALVELMGALAPEKSPEIACSLLGLYGYFFRRITDTRLEPAPEPLKDVIRLWSELRDGWQELLRRGTADTSDTSDTVRKQSGRLVFLTG